MAKRKGPVAHKVKPRDASDLPICEHCGKRTFLTRSAYLAEIKRGFTTARATRYVAGAGPVCHKCWPEVCRLREWRKMATPFAEAMRDAKKRMRDEMAN